MKCILKILPIAGSFCGEQYKKEKGSQQLLQAANKRNAKSLMNPGRKGKIIPKEEILSFIKSPYKYHFKISLCYSFLKNLKYSYIKKIQSLKILKKQYDI